MTQFSQITTSYPRRLQRMPPWWLIKKGIKLRLGCRKKQTTSGMFPLLGARHVWICLMPLILWSFCGKLAFGLEAPSNSHSITGNGQQWKQFVYTFSLMDYYGRLSQKNQSDRLHPPYVSQPLCFGFRPCFPIHPFVMSCHWLTTPIHLLAHPHPYPYPLLSAFFRQCAIYAAPSSCITDEKSMKDYARTCETQPVVATGMEGRRMR